MEEERLVVSLMYPMRSLCREFRCILTSREGVDIEFISTMKNPVTCHDVNGSSTEIP